MCGIHTDTHTHIHIYVYVCMYVYERILLHDSDDDTFRSACILISASYVDILAVKRDCKRDRDCDYDHDHDRDRDRDSDHDCDCDCDRYRDRDRGAWNLCMFGGTRCLITCTHVLQ